MQSTLYFIYLTINKPSNSIIAYICAEYYKYNDMFTIRKATTDDCGLIHKLAWQIFPETYKEILSKEQTEYMM